MPWQVECGESKLDAASVALRDFARSLVATAKHVVCGQDVALGEGQAYAGTTDWFTFELDGVGHLHLHALISGGGGEERDVAGTSATKSKVLPHLQALERRSHFL